jgi:hypothetical protein
LDISSPPVYKANTTFIDPNSTLEDGSTAFTSLNSILEDDTISVDLITTLEDSTAAFIDLITTLEDSTTAFTDLNLPPVYRTDTSFRSTDQIYSWIKGNIPTTTCQVIQQKKVCILKERLLWSTSPLLKAYCPELYSNWFGLTKYTRATGLATLPFTLIRDALVNILLQVIRDAFELWCTERRAKQYIANRILDISTCLEATLIVIRDLGLEIPSILDRKSRADEIRNVFLSQEYNEDRVILLTVTLVVTAIISQFLPEGTLCLVPGNALSRTYCPSFFLELFDLIYCLKANPILTNILPQHLDTVPTIVYFLQKLVPILKGSTAEANNILLQLQQLFPTIYKIKLRISRSLNLIEQFKDRIFYLQF